MVLPPIGLSPEQHPIVVWPTVQREEGERERERERERVNIEGSNVYMYVPVG